MLGQGLVLVVGQLQPQQICVQMQQHCGQLPHPVAGKELRQVESGLLQGQVQCQPEQQDRLQQLPEQQSEPALQQQPVGHRPTSRGHPEAHDDVLVHPPIGLPRHDAVDFPEFGIIQGGVEGQQLLRPPNRAMVYMVAASHVCKNNK